MEPGHNSSPAPEILPPVVETGADASASDSPARPEAYPATPETAGASGQVAPPASIPSANPLALPAAPSPSDSSAASPVATAAIPKDTKSTEELKKTFIANVRKIITENSSDPYTEVKLIEQTKVAYMRDVYNRQIKLPQE